MRTLTKSAYDKAVTFLNDQARPLEKALYATHFANAPASLVLDALSVFQNGDGGFGHGLECDIRLDDSSVIATTIAFQRFREINAPADHPVIQRACRYLLDQYDDQQVNWPIIPPNIDEAAHAPWWVHGGDLEKSKSNPRAEIVGYINDYPEYFSKEMCEKVTKAVATYLFSQPPHMEMHDLLCYIRFWEARNLPAAVRVAVLEQLQQIVENTVERRPEQWRNYSLPPLAVINSPESPFASLFQEEIEQNLDFIIELQDQDGTWGPNWTWGDQWAEIWPQAQQEWTGVLTLNNLRLLKAFGRIA